MSEDGQETKSITVSIAGRPYPLKIKASEEADIRRIVKELNDRINRFQSTYANKDKQDCLSMAALTYAVESHKANQAIMPDGVVNQKLTRLDELLDKLLLS